MGFFDKIRSNTESDDHSTKVQEILVKDIIPNRYQPRTEFNEDSINELAETIKEHGLLQPIIVREYEKDKFEIIAGERRFRAVSTLGWDKISAIINNLTDEETASMALIENLQRKDLNPIEEAIAYKELMKVNDFTQVQLSEQMGKSQSYIANKLRLLKLNPEVRQGIIDGKITQRHGRALLTLEDGQQLEAYKTVIDNGLNVKETEELIRKLLIGSDKKAPKKKTVKAIKNKDLKLSVNTIKKSITMIKDSGAKVKTKEIDNGDEYEIVIRIKK